MSAGSRWRACSASPAGSSSRASRWQRSGSAWTEGTDSSVRSGHRLTGIDQGLDAAADLDDLGGRLLRRAGVERRLRVVLDAELDRLGDLVAGDVRGERQAHIDAGGHAGGG